MDKKFKNVVINQFVILLVIILLLGLVKSCQAYGAISQVPVRGVVPMVCEITNFGSHENTYFVEVLTNSPNFVLAIRSDNHFKIIHEGTGTGKQSITFHMQDLLNLVQGEGFIIGVHCSG